MFDGYLVLAWKFDGAVPAGLFKERHEALGWMCEEYGRLMHKNAKEEREALDGYEIWKIVGGKIDPAKEWVDIGRAMDLYGPAITQHAGKRGA
jgi:hypothetical protein